MTRKTWRIFLLAMLFLAGNTTAHTRSESYSHWYIGDNSLSGTVTIPLREVMLLYNITSAEQPPRDTFHNHLLENLWVYSDGADCKLTSSNTLQAASGFVRVEVNFSCGEQNASSLKFRAMFDVAPSHVHYAQIHRDGRQLAENLLTDAADSWEIAALSYSPSQTFVAFLSVGVEHIAGGIDHIAFLVGLLLVAGSFGRSVVAVTGFTLGHSVSLVVAVLGYVSAESQLVEAFIGFTVALVAMEYFVLRRTDINRFALLALTLSLTVGLIAVVAGFLPPLALYTYAGFGVFAACYLVAANHFAQRDAKDMLLLFVATACFGLIHGFGFAGFLMDTGLLGASLFLPLLGFNLGVEVGQLAIVAVLLLLARLTRQITPEFVPQAIAAALCGIGVFWFVGRTLA